MIDAVDSYFQNIVAGIAIANPNRQVIGISDAMDWPPKNVIPEAFYLLVVGSRGITGRSFWSSAVPVQVHTLQWVWIITGTDLVQNKAGRNRGDRYRTNMKMRDELIAATQSAWWTPKLQWSVLGSTPGGLALQSTPMKPAENIWWTPLTFLNRIDQTSGTVYGAASVQVTDMTGLTATQ